MDTPGQTPVGRNLKILYTDLFMILFVFELNCIKEFSVQLQTDIERTIQDNIYMTENINQQ
jgi:hypothetical protein